MTVASETDRVEYTGNGAVSSYSYTFRILASDEIACFTLSGTTQAELALTTGFTVSGVGQTSGGTISLVNGPLASGSKLVIMRDVGILQSTALAGQRKFFGSSVEAGLDKLAMIEQMLNEMLNRCIKFSETDSSALTSTIAIAATRANTYLAFDASGNVTTAAGAVFTAMTAGSVIFAGSNGLPTQNNASFFWDSVNTTLKLTGALITTASFQTQVTGDSSPRFKLTADGSMKWTQSGQTAGQYLLKFETPNPSADPTYNISMRPFGNAFGSSIPNNHMAFGWNSGKDRLAPEDTTKPSFQLVFEDYYLQSAGNPQSEIYIEYYTASATPTSWRPWSAYINQTTGVTNVNGVADTYSYYSRSTTNLLMQMASNSVSYYNATPVATIIFDAQQSKISTTVAGGSPAAGGTLAYHSEGTVPGVGFYETGAAANSRHWELFANTATLTCRVANDAYNSFGTVFSVTRSGTTVSLFTFGSAWTGTSGTLTGTLSLGTVPASTGSVRMTNATGIYVRNAANSADLLAVNSDSSNNLFFGNSTAGNFFGYGGTCKINFFGQVAAVVQQVSAANLTNSVTSGGTDNTITNWTDLTTYATDAAAIRNAVYQLARKLKQVNDGLRAYGLLT